MSAQKALKGLRRKRGSCWEELENCVSPDWVIDFLLKRNRKNWVSDQTWVSQNWYFFQVTTPSMGLTPAPTPRFSLTTPSLPSPTPTWPRPTTHTTRWAVTVDTPTTPQAPAIQGRAAAALPPTRGSNSSHHSRLTTLQVWSLTQFCTQQNCEICSISGHQLRIVMKPTKIQ